MSGLAPTPKGPWAKTSTGGAAVQDTGWRHITAPFAGELAIRRIGNIVYAVGENLRPAATGDNVLMALPSGFRPSGGKSPVGVGFEGTTLRQVQAFDYSPFNLTVKAIGAANSWVLFNHTWLTDDAWPSTLPGTA